jgi:hypothetical protein
MRMRVKCILFVSSVVTVFTAQVAVGQVDGRNRVFQDSTLDRLVGHWNVERTMEGRTTSSDLRGEWVLNHQYLLLHYQQPHLPSATAYEAMVFIGYDNASERYVAHWIDVFGGRFSETLGYGIRNGNAVHFVFEYPDGPFHNTFTFDPVKGSWTSLLRTKNAKGEWVTFGNEQIVKTSN